MMFPNGSITEVIPPDCKAYGQKQDLHEGTGDQFVLRMGIEAVQRYA
jgi:hypothetical protein